MGLRKKGNYVATGLVNLLNDGKLPIIRTANSTVRVPGLYPVSSGFESLAVYHCLVVRASQTIINA